ncbi:MAG: hypothetical protein ACRERV_16935, partial [Methylococcales bacterium]
ILLSWKAWIGGKKPGTITGSALDSMEEAREDRHICWICLFDPEEPFPNNEYLQIDIDGNATIGEPGSFARLSVRLPDPNGLLAKLKSRRLIYRIEARQVLNTGERTYRGQQIMLEQIFETLEGKEFKFEVGYRVDAETRRIERVVEYPQQRWLGGVI